jgi:hypothetical protein
VHPEAGPDKLGITDDMFNTVTNSDHPLAFWQLTVPESVRNKPNLLRLVAMRVCAATAAALGCERLWSKARLTLTDNRRSMLSDRLAQLLQVKMNIHMLADSNLLDSLGVKLGDVMHEFESIFDDILQFEEEELAEQLALEVQVSNQPSGDQLCEHDQHGDEEAPQDADDDFDLFD